MADGVGVAGARVWGGGDGQALRSIAHYGQKEVIPRIAD